MKNFVPGLVAVLLVAAGGLYLWFRSPSVEPTPPPAAVAQRPASAASAPAPEPQYAIAEAPAAPLQAHEVRGAVESLVGKKESLRFLQVEDFPRRVAATVDALGRTHAAATGRPLRKFARAFAWNASSSGSAVLRLRPGSRRRRDRRCEVA